MHPSLPARCFALGAPGNMLVVRFASAKVQRKMVLHVAFLWGGHETKEATDAQRDSLRPLRGK